MSWESHSKCCSTSITFSSSAGSLALVSSVEVVVVVEVESVLCLRLSLANLASPLSLVELNLASPLSLVETHLSVESWDRDGVEVVVDRLLVLHDTIANTCNWHYCQHLDDYSDQFNVWMILLINCDMAVLWSWCFTTWWFQPGAVYSAHYLPTWWSSYEDLMMIVYENVIMFHNMTILTRSRRYRGWWSCIAEKLSLGSAAALTSKKLGFASPFCTKFMT